jgi:hypothetical protein
MAVTYYVALQFIRTRVDPIRRLRESIPCRTKAPRPLTGRGCPHFEYQGTQRAALGGRWSLRQFSHPSKAVVRRSDQRRADRGRARLSRLQDQVRCQHRVGCCCSIQRQRWSARSVRTVWSQRFQVQGYAALSNSFCSRHAAMAPKPICVSCTATKFGETPTCCPVCLS